MLHKYQELKAMNTLHWFISAETSRIQEKNKDKSIHKIHLLTIRNYLYCFSSKAIFEAFTNQAHLLQHFWPGM